MPYVDKAVFELLKIYRGCLNFYSLGKKLEKIKNFKVVSFVHIAIHLFQQRKLLVYSVSTVFKNKLYFENENENNFKNLIFISTQIFIVICTGI